MTSSTTTTTTSTTTSTLMSELVSYPVLILHEESLTQQHGSMYDVSSWMLYLSEIDSLLDQMNDILNENNNKSKQKSSSNKRNRSGFGISYSIGGRDVSSSEFKTCVGKLQMARNLVSERSLSLLPGSYKLWKDYLDFRSRVYITSPYTSIAIHQNDDDDTTNNNSSIDLDIQASSQQQQQQQQQPYPVISSIHTTKYKSTISAYERSLVRMNKYPRIWLSYLSFVYHNDPLCSVTNIRRLFNRSLLALAVTQHELIWSEYLTFILQDVPPQGLIVSKSGGAGGVGSGNNVGPIVQSIQGGSIPEDYSWDIPSETVLRVLRRYAHYYNPTARELLANVALEHGRYGEAASTYVEILNDVDFVSVQGSTRHELWMKLAEICTEHPTAIGEGSDTGVDFEGIVRSVLQPPQEGKGSSSGFGWDVMEESTSSNDNEGGGSEKNESVEQERKRKVEQQQAQLRASLGEMEGTLWNKLAQYHVQNGEFEVARSTYEEAMESVSRVRDFSLIFDKYIQFEEGVIEAMMEMLNEEEEDEEDESGDGASMNQDNSDKNNSKQEEEEEDMEDMDILLGIKTKATNQEDDDEQNTSADIELALARAENLLGRRPLLLNRVLLRQNPNNIGEWLKRSDLYINLEKPTQAIAALEEALKDVNPRQYMNGALGAIYIALAGIYETKMNDLSSARSVYERVCRPKPEREFKETDDLAKCYTSWVEMELRVEQWDDALSIARQSVSYIKSEISNRVTRGLAKSLRLWNLLLDLEETLGTVQTTKDAYNRIFDFKVATPSHVLNYASYLLEKKFFEESFTAYERGVDLFPFPHPSAQLLWKTYLDKFQERYAGTKTHRMRELFDRCLETCPPDVSSEFYIMYGTYEEKYGLSKRALGVYEKMCTNVDTDEKLIAYQLYITKTIKYVGVIATRPLYERAIAALNDKAAAQICCEFAKMEASLQEIDRARTAFTYGAQLADPRRNPEYWGEWHTFEVSHGNEETFREMLRVKRGVQAAFSTVNYNAAEMGAGAPATENLTDEQALQMIAEREGVDISNHQQQQKEGVSGFVQGKRTAEIKDLDEVERRAAKLRKVTAGLVAATQNKQEEEAQNNGDDEIEIDDEEEEEDDEGESANEPITNAIHKIKDVETKIVPAAVFGSLVK